MSGNLKMDDSRTDGVLKLTKQYQTIYNDVLRMYTFGQPSIQTVDIEEKRSILNQIAARIFDLLESSPPVDQSECLLFVRSIPTNESKLVELTLTHLFKYREFSGTISLWESDLWNIGHWGLLEIIVKSRLLGLHQMDVVIRSDSNERQASEIVLALFKHYSFITSDLPYPVAPTQDSVLLLGSESVRQSANTTTFNQRRLILGFPLQQIQNLWHQRFSDTAIFRQSDLPMDLIIPTEFRSKIGSRWIALLHVRDGGYRLEHPDFSWSKHRSGDLASYIDACAYIYSIGGVTVRLGNPRMIPCPDVPFILDYAFCSERSSFHELSLYALSKVFIGGSSGPQTLVSVFGIPRVHLDVILWDTLDIARTDEVILPKIYFSPKKQSLLPLAEYVKPSLRTVHLYPEFLYLDVDLLNNSPEDILDAVKEHLGAVQRFDGSSQVNVETATSEFYALLSEYCESPPSFRIARSFWNRFKSHKLVNPSVRHELL